MPNFDQDFVSEYTLMRDVQDELEKQETKHKEKVKKVLMIWGLIQTPFLVLIILDVEYLGLWGIILLSSSIILLVVYFILKSPMKNRILYDMIFPKAVHLFHQDHEIEFDYQFKPKLQTSFNH